VIVSDDAHVISKKMKIVKKVKKEVKKEMKAAKKTAKKIGKSMKVEGSVTVGKYTLTKR